MPFEIHLDTLPRTIFSFLTVSVFKAAFVCHSQRVSCYEKVIMVDTYPAVRPMGPTGVALVPRTSSVFLRGQDGWRSSCLKSLCRPS